MKIISDHRNQMSGSGSAGRQADREGGDGPTFYMRRHLYSLPCCVLDAFHASGILLSLQHDWQNR